MSGKDSQEPPVVFISYSHDEQPDGHMDRVLAFADQLIADGIDCVLDQYEEAPPEGWPMWMDRQIRQADFVLMVCTKAYYRRVSVQEETGKGRGVKWEGRLVFQHFYKGDSLNEKFIPILFSYCDADHIPDPFQSDTYYIVDISEQYEKLYARLTGRRYTSKPERGIIRELRQKPRKTNFFDPDALQAEKEYKAVLKEDLGTIKMLGSPDVPNVPVDLLDTFVSLDITAMSSGQCREGLEPNQMRGETDRKLSPESTLKRAFEDHRMLLILGDPGSGKTTLVNYYAMLCLKNRHVELGLDEPTLPIYLPIREVESTDGGLCPLHECLVKWASRHYISISANTFLGWLKDRRTLVLLDGLDEISDLDRRREICEWIDSAAEKLAKARFVVTSRWTGYRKVDGIELGFPHLRADVRDFSDEQQTEFLQKWFIAAYLREPRDEKEPEPQWRQRQRQKGLDRAKAIVDFLAEEENQGVRELAVVPMLLQVIAILWRERENLPEGRAELYKAAVNYLLVHRDRPKKIKALLPSEKALRVIRPASFWMQHELHSDEVEKKRMHGHMRPILDTMKEKVEPKAFCDYLRDRAGLIADYGKDSYIFRHKSFREYLAGRELVTKAERDTKSFEQIVSRFGEDWWSEPLRFFMGEVDDTLFDQFMEAFFKSEASKNLDQKSYNLLLTMVSEAPQRRIDSLIRRLFDEDSTENQRRYIVDCLKTIGTEEARDVIGVFAIKQMGTAIGRFATSVAAEEHITAEVTTGAPVDVFKHLPESFRNSLELNAEYIHVPGGSFKYFVSQKKEAVPDIYFAKYPVTNKRFRRFMRYLRDEEPNLTQVLPKGAFDHRMKPLFPEIPDLGEFLGDHPADWADKLQSTYDTEKRFDGEDQPIVGVSWYAARAYCLWLSLLEVAHVDMEMKDLTNLYRLPTELEWEWVASGGERTYPWGDMEPNNKLANYNCNENATTPIGRYPEGATPDGLMDMAGNVWEWMENWYDKDKDTRSLRGGSWGDSKVRLCCSVRNGNHPAHRYPVVGFRVVRSQS